MPLASTEPHILGRAIGRMMDLTRPAQVIGFAEYRAAVREAHERVELLTESMRAQLEHWWTRPAFEALMTLRGIDLMAAMTVVDAIGDFAPLCPRREKSVGFVLETEVLASHRALAARFDPFTRSAPKIMQAEPELIPYALLLDAPTEVLVQSLDRVGLRNQFRLRRWIADEVEESRARLLDTASHPPTAHSQDRYRSISSRAPTSPRT